MNNTKHSQNKLPYYMSHRAPLYFLFYSVLCQIIGMGCLWIIKDVLRFPFVLLGLHSVISFLLARWLRLSLPWQLFNLLVAPGVVMYTTLGLPSGFALFAVVITVLMYLPTFWTRVPYYPTHRKMYEAILKQLPEDKPFLFIDLGCGLGTLLEYLATNRKLGKFEGVEISPLPVLISLMRMKCKRMSNVRVRWKNFWSLSLEPFDYVYAFLAPGPMPALWEKAGQEMRKGTVFITNTFEVHENPNDVIHIDDSHQGKLYVHEM